MEVDQMEIPIIQYCIMKNAIECFKFLLVNGYDDPNKAIGNSSYWDRYKWDCMATAIYYGNNEIINILENRGIEKGNNQSHIEDIIEKHIEENENLLISRELNY